MTRLIKLLNERVVILKTSQTPNGSGGFDRGYSEIAKIWAQIIPIAQASRDIANFAAYIRGKQVNSSATHKMKCRRIAVEDVGAGFTNGFNRGFVVAGNLEILKSEYYVLRQRGGTDGAYAAGFDTGYNQTEGLVGNLYRILSGVDNHAQHEYLEIRLEEIEEQGVGASA